MCAQLLGAVPAAAQPDPPPPPPAGEEGPGPGDDADGPRHEIVEKRTENAKFFEEADGTYTAELYAGPVHFEDEQGHWRDIDTKLVGTAEQGWGWKNRAGAFSATFAATADTEELVRMRDEDGGLAFGLLGADMSSEPDVEGSTITYPDVFPGVDVMFEVRNSDLKEVIVLKTRPKLPRNGKASFKFPLRAHGLRAVQEQPGGEVLLFDEEGKAQFGIPKLWMNDSSVDPRSGEPAFSDDLSLTLVEHGNAQFLEVDVPAEWLLDPARVYPVYVDPTVTPNPFVPTKDTFVQSNIFNTPQDGADELKAGTYDGSTVARSLLKFDVSSLRGKSVTNAKLSLYNHWSWSCNPRTVEVYRIATQWNSDVTWSNKPNFAPDRADSKSAAWGYTGCANNRIVFDNVTEPVKYWLNRPEENHGFGIKAADETDVYGWKRFHSSEGSQKPHLVVTYEEPFNQAPLIPIDLSPQSPHSGDTTPVLSGRYRDPDAGDGGKVEFRFTTSSGGGTTVASGEGDFAEPGQMSTWGNDPGNPFPPGALTPGQTYWWQARSWDHNLRSAWSEPRRYDVLDDIKNLPPNVPTQPEPQSSGTGGRTPTLSVLYSDPEGNPGNVRFDVFDAFGNFVTTGDSALTSSGSRASWTVPEGFLAYSTTYYWDARAYDGLRWSARTARFKYTVQPEVVNAPPYAPYNLQPANGSSGGPSPVLSGTFDDPNQGDSGYLTFRVFYNGALIAEGNGTHVERGQTSSWTVPTGLLQEQRAYQWYAFAYDGMAISGNSPTYTYNVFTDGSRPPYQPTQLEPWHGTRSLEVKPTLSALYNDPDTGDDGQIYFEIYSVDASGVRTLWNGGWGTTAGVQQRSSWSPAPLTTGRNYEWRAISWDGDQWGPWSVWHSYSVTEPNYAPRVPSGLTPADGTVSNDATPMLTAYYDDDNAGDFGYIWFEIWKVQNGTRTFVQGRYSDYIAPDSWGTWTVDQGLMQPGTTYEWRAQAFDDWEQSGFTPFRTYTPRIDTPPLTPTDLSPADNTSSTNKRPTFTARYTDPDGDPGHLLFFVDKVVGSVQSNEQYYDSGRISSGTLVSWTVPQDLFQGVTYKWRVQAYDPVNFDGPYSAYRSYKVIDLPPPAPIATSTSHPDPNKWETNTSATFTWTEPIDESGITAYSYEFVKRPGSVPDEQPDPLGPGGLRRMTYQVTSSGEWWFGVRARDGNGQWGATGYRRILVDTDPPTMNAVTSPTHPDPNKAYVADDVVIEWPQASALSGITGYSYVFDTEESTVPDEQVDNGAFVGPGGTFRRVEYPNVEMGVHYFHVRALSGTGIWGPVKTFRVAIHPLADATPFAVFGEMGDLLEVTPPEVLDVGDLVPPPAEGLGDLLPPGGLLGDGPFFDGDLLPALDPADEIAEAFAVMVPPDPPMPDIGPTVTEVGDLFTAFATLPGPDPLQLVGATEYQVHTTAYGANGQVLNERDDTIRVCTPMKYNSKTDDLAVPEPTPETPLTTYDLKIRLCPVATSVIPGSPVEIEYELDALKDGTRVEVVATYAALGRRLHLDTLAKQIQHPRDFGLTLGSQGLNETQGTNVLDASSSGRLEELRVRVDRETPPTYTREGRITIANLPARETATQRHRFIFETSEQSAPQRRQTLRVKLENGAPNPNESLVLESYDPLSEGRLQARLKFDGIPQSFDRTLQTDATGGRAQPDKVTISGTQSGERQQETLVLEQWQGERLLGRGTIESFPKEYVYVVNVIRDAADRENGLRFQADFDQGRPDGGSFRLGRFHRNQTNGEDELDGLLQVDRFARHTLERLEALRDVDGRPIGANFKGEFTGSEPPAEGNFKLARFRLDDATPEDERRDLFEIGRFAPDTNVVASIDGAPGNPTGLHIKVVNSDAVPHQLIEILRTPANARRARLILAGTDVAESRIAPAVTGSNLRWDAMPRCFDLDIAVAKQANGIPSNLTLTNSGNCEAPENGRLRLTQDDGSSLLGFVVKAPTKDQDVTVKFAGTLSKPTMARISRVNHENQPQAALQFFQQTGGALTSQIRFMGPAATMAGLAEGTPDKLDGVARDVPNKFDYGLQVERNGAGAPAHAVISGTVGDFAPAFDVELQDRLRGFRLFQRSFTQTFRYEVVAEEFQDGRPRKATISGEQSGSNKPGRLELSYGGMKFLMDSLMKIFEFKIEVEGPFANPTGAELSQTQSGPNPDQVVQMVRSGPTGPRAALTMRNAPAILDETASATDVVWTNIPQDFELTFGRDPLQSGGERLSLVADQKGEDKPSSVVRVGRTTPQNRQEIRLEGLAPRWSAKARYEGELQNAPVLVLDVASSVRHDGDLIKLMNFVGANLTHHIVLRGNDNDSLSGDNPSRMDGVITSIPEAMFLKYKRIKSGAGDAGLSVDLTNQAVVGPTLEDRERRANLDGVVQVVMKNGGPSEVVKLSDLPGHLHVEYDRPPVMTDGRQNCLGQIKYNASGSTLDLRLNAYMSGGCAQGPLAAHAVDVPADGFAVAKIHPDGNGRIKVAGSEAITKMTVGIPAPDEMREFFNRDISGDDMDAQFCKPFGPGDLGCSHIKIEANPQYKNVRLNVTAHQLKDVRIATNIGSNGEADPYPGASTRDEDRKLWDFVPLMAVRNNSPGPVVAKLQGDDVTSEQNWLHQDVQCCNRLFKTSNHSMDYSLDQPLKIRFYTWFVRQGSCSGPAGSGPDPRVCNSDGEEIRDEYGQNIHCGLPFFDEPVPFPPRFSAFAELNTIHAVPGETMYYVPNLYDMFMSEPDPDSGLPRRWISKNLARTCQSDWYFASMLREYEPDLLRGALEGL